MNRKQAALGESEQFQQEFVHGARKIVESRTEVLAVIAHEHRDAVGWRGMMLTNAHFSIAPLSRPLRAELARDETVKFENEVWSRRIVLVGDGGDLPFDKQHPLREQRGQLAITQDTAAGFD